MAAKHSVDSPVNGGGGGGGGGRGEDLSVEPVVSYIPGVANTR